MSNKPMNKADYNKAYAVGEYVKGLGASIAEMMQRGDHIEYTWNNGPNNNFARKEMLDAIHEKAIEAIKLINL